MVTVHTFFTHSYPRPRYHPRISSSTKAAFNPLLLTPHHIQIRHSPISCHGEDCRNTPTDSFPTRTSEAAYWKLLEEARNVSQLHSRRAHALHVSRQLRLTTLYVPCCPHAPTRTGKARQDFSAHLPTIASSRRHTRAT